MKRPTDRQPPRPSRAMIDALGHRQERISEYFNFQGPDGAEKGDRKVKRYELLAILEQIERGKANMKLHRRIWRWLTSRASWGATKAAPPTKGEIERGELTETGEAPPA